MVCSEGTTLICRRKVINATSGSAMRSDETQSGAMTQVFSIGDTTFGVLLGEELHEETEAERNGQSPPNPIRVLADNGATTVLSLNASPFRVGVGDYRRSFVRQLCTQFKVGIVWSNLIGVRGDVVFDGDSFAFNELGKIIGWATPFQRQVMAVPTKFKIGFSSYSTMKLDEEVLWAADFVRRSGEHRR